MKPRNISGIYFRYQNPDTNKWENWCFEDLPLHKQQEYINDRSIEWLKSMVITLSTTLKKVCDTCDITTEP